MIKKLIFGTLLGVMSFSAMAENEYSYLSEAKPVDYKYNDYYYQRASQFAEMPVDSDDIIFLGNSLTNGGRWNEMFDNVNIKNRGIISDVVQGVSDRLDMISKGHPKKLFLLIGANDVSHHLTNDSIARAIEKLVVKLKTDMPGTELYLQSCLPINNSYKRYKNIFNKEDSIRIINVRLEQVAEKHGINWINMYAAFADKDANMRKDLTTDGLHLNENGYKIWRDKVKEYVAPGVEFDNNAPLYHIDNDDVVILGNSLVGYAEWSELFGSLNVKGRSTGGDVSTYLPQLAKNVAKNTPKEILLLSSFNYDASTPKGLNVSPNFNADEILKSMEQAILGIREVSPETVIYLQSLTPVNSSYTKYAAFKDKTKAIKNVNKKLKKLAKKHKVVWVDMYPAFADETGELKAEFTNDGFHLMGKGYIAWREILKNYLNK